MTEAERHRPTRWSNDARATRIAPRLGAKDPAGRPGAPGQAQHDAGRDGRGGRRTPASSARIPGFKQLGRALEAQGHGPKLRGLRQGRQDDGAGARHGRPGWPCRCRSPRSRRGYTAPMGQAAMARARLDGRLRPRPTAKGRNDRRRAPRFESAASASARRTRRRTARSGEAPPPCEGRHTTAQACRGRELGCRCVRRLCRGVERAARSLRPEQTRQSTEQVTGPSRDERGRREAGTRGASSELCLSAQ